MGDYRSRLKLRRAVALTLSTALTTAVLLGAPDAARAADDGSVRNFNIAPQSMSLALRDFSNTTSLQIIFSEDDVRDLSAPQLEGSYTADEALRLLLAGSGLVVERTPSGVVMVRRQVERSASAAPAAIKIAQAPAPSAQRNTSESAQGPSELEEVLVTGSRVLVDGFSAPTPVTVMTAESLATRAPANVADGLNTLPQFRGSFGPRQEGGSGGGAGSLGHTLNLRGLGANRALIMLDGVRVPPTHATGSVNVDLLPQGLVQRVDIVTGGVSAAYGSDAVTGVVNFILDKEFEGIKGSAQAGRSTYGDMGSEKAVLSGGWSFADGAGHFLASVEHQYDGGINNEDRPLGRKQYVMGGTGTAANPFTIYENGRIGTMSYGGRILTGPLANYRFEPNGTVVPFVAGASTGGPATNQIGGDGFAHGGVAAIQDLKRDGAFARVSYDITPSINFHIQSSLHKEDSEADYVYPYAFPGSPSVMTIFADNAFMDPSVRAALGSTPSFQLARESRDQGSMTSWNRSKKFGVNAGFDGEMDLFDRGWHWDVTYVYDTTEVHGNLRDAYLPHVFAAIDAVRDSSGNIVCRVTITNPGAYPGCTPLNVMGEGRASQAAIDYIYGISKYLIDSGMEIANANIRGDLFEGWAGPISIAVGAEWRHQTLEQTSNANPAVPIDFMGVRGVPPSNTSFRFVNRNTGAAKGEVTVKEAYTEVLVPLAKDLPFVEALDLNAAVRATDYSTSGAVTTWKVGATYQPVGDLTVRGTVSRDIAAPSLFNLYNAGTVTGPITADPHTNVNSVTTVINRGNPDLDPERSSTMTIGLVFNPRWLEGFSGSIDYYRFKITDAIGAPNATQILNQCELTNGLGPTCALVDRPLPFSNRTAANFPTQIRVIPINTAQLVQSGIDFDFRYRMPASSFFDSWSGDFDVAVLSSVLLSSKDSAGPAFPFVDHRGETINQKVNGSLQLGYSNEVMSVHITERFTGSSNASNTTVYAPPYDKWPNRMYTDLNLTYQVVPQAQAFLNVTNVFNEKPPLGDYIGPFNVPGLQLMTLRPVYDVVGTYFTAGVRVKF